MRAGRGASARWFGSPAPGRLTWPFGALASWKCRSGLQEASVSSLAQVKGREKVAVLVGIVPGRNTLSPALRKCAAFRVHSIARLERCAAFRDGRLGLLYRLQGLFEADERLEVVLLVPRGLRPVLQQPPGTFQRRSRSLSVAFRKARSPALEPRSVSTAATTFIYIYIYIFV